MIAWCHCTPPSIVKTFGEKNFVPSGSGKEIAGLLKKKKKKKEEMMTPKSRNRVRTDCCAPNLEAGRNGLGLCMARDESQSSCCVVLKA